MPSPLPTIDPAAQMSEAQLERAFEELGGFTAQGEELGVVEGLQAAQAQAPELEVEPAQEELEALAGSDNTEVFSSFFSLFTGRGKGE